MAFVRPKAQTIPQVDSLVSKALILQTSNIEQMMITADSIKLLSIRNDYHRGKAYYYLFKAIDLRSKMDIISALDYLDSAITIFKKIHDKHGLIQAYNELLMSVRFIKRNRTLIPPKPRLGNSALAKLLSLEYDINAIIYDSTVSPDSLKRLLYYVKKIKYNENNRLERFYYKHNLAKLNYDLARLYEKAKQLDSALKYYKRSIYYDRLLKNRQAWSVFTTADLYLKLFEQDTTRHNYLDSAKKYNRLSLKVLNYYKPLKQNYLDFIDSLAKNKIYVYQVAHVAKNYLNYMIWTKSADQYAMIKLNTISDNLFQQMQKLPSEYYAKLVEIKTQKNKFRITILSTVLVFLIIIILLILWHERKLNEKNNQLIQRNQQLNKLTKELEKLTRELKNKNEELEEKTRELSQTNEILQEKNKILRLKSIVIESIAHSLSHIENTLYKLAKSEINNSLTQEIILYTPMIINALKFFQNIGEQLEDDYSVFYFSEIIKPIENIIKLYPEINVNKNIHDFRIKTNKVMLSQILYNVIHNSIKALKSKKIDNPQITIYTQEYNSNSYCVEIQDNALGMDIEIINQLNNLQYERGKNSGLYLIQEFSKLLNLKYEFSLTEDGTKFKIYFKL